MTVANDKIAAAIDRNFTSPNVLDSNWEAANVVDALAQIARAGFAIAEALKQNATDPPPEGTHR